MQRLDKQWKAQLKKILEAATVNGEIESDLLADALVVSTKVMRKMPRDIFMDRMVKTYESISSIILN